MNPAVRLGSCSNIEIRTVPHSGRLNRWPGYPNARIAEAIFQATKADTHKVVMPESDSAIQALVDSRFQPGVRCMEFMMETVLVSAFQAATWPGTAIWHGWARRSLISSSVSIKGHLAAPRKAVVFTRANKATPLPEVFRDGRTRLLAIKQPMIAPPS